MYTLKMMLVPNFSFLDWFSFSSGVDSWYEKNFMSADDNEKQPKEWKLGTYHFWGIIKNQFAINKWAEINNYSVKPISAELGKNTQLIWIELSLAWSGLS